MSTRNSANRFPRLLLKHSLPVVAAVFIMGCSLASAYLYEQINAHRPTGFVQTAVTSATWIIALLAGAVGGLLISMMQKCSSRRAELAAANEELERLNHKLQPEAQKEHQSELRFRVLFSGNPYPMWIFDCSTLALLDVNEAALKQYGYTREEFLNLSAADLRPPEEVPRFLSIIRRANHGYQVRGTWRHRRKDGSCLYVEVGVFRFAEDGNPRELVLAQDVTAAVEAKAALRKSEAALQQLVNNAPFGISSSSLENDSFCEFNPAMLRMLGYTREEMLSLRLSTQLYAKPDDRSRMLERLRRSGKVDAFETSLLRNDGTPVRVRGWAVLKDYPAGKSDELDVYVQDLTEQSGLEQQIRQVQKLEAVGRLAGGIAHDFNNILVVIRLSTELMLGQVAYDSPFSKPLLQVLKAADRAAALTRQLLAFGRQQVMQSRTLNLNSVVVDTLHLLRRTIGEDVELLTKLSDDLQNTRLDPDQLAQVIMNLAINARDAMPRGGTLHIETSNVELDDGYAKTHNPMRAGRYVLLAVSDTGSGIPKEILPRIFDPFFTTKEVGKGTGLGLSIVYGIVKQSGGYIWAYSEPGQGTTFKLYFPVTTEDAFPVAQPEVVNAVAGDHTILVVEDEEQIRANLRSCLQQLGYNVVEAADGLDAIDIIASGKVAIDLVLTDLVMPRMGGHELSVQLNALNPSLSILFMSGYTEDTAARGEILEKGSPFLTKPFSVAELSQAVQRALGTPALAGVS
jgi:PAS domain S-box-containing protein